MTNTFSIAVSKALASLGVEGETEFYFTDIQLKYNQVPVLYGYPTSWVARGGTLDSYWGEGTYIQAYTLHDILRLMPKIGEKCELGKAVLNQDTWKKQTSGVKKLANADMAKLHSRSLLDAFLEGDYPKAEEYLLTIIKK